MKICRHIVAFCFLIMAVPAILFAQSTNATIAGQVTDPSKAVIPQVKVVAINTNTNIQYGGLTNRSGQYVLPSIQPGDYRIEVEKAGFRTIIKPNVVLHVQDTVELNFEMAVGSASESITVRGGAPLINAQDATVSTVIDRQFVANIPLNGRTIQNLINLTPGVVVTTSKLGDSGQFSVNGQRADSNYFTVDGVSANFGTDTLPIVRASSGTVPGFSATGTTSNLVSVDAIQEFRIQTSTFAPEFGRTPGAQVAITTRSGTNQFHGTAFDYFRNSALDASNWFNGFLGLPKGVERQNDFGGVLGGPIYRNKTFFFFSYEGQRLSQPTPMETFVPDANSRTLVPSAVQPLLNAFPLPNVPETPDQIASGIAQLNGTAANTSTLNATSLRLDDTLTKTWSVFARYNYAPSTVVNQGIGGDALSVEGTTGTKTQTGTAGMTKTFGAHIANETLFNWTRYNTLSSNALTNFGGATVPMTTQLVPPSEGVTLPPGQPLTFELGLIGGAGSAYDTGPFAKNIQRQINLVDNFSYQMGTHQLKFGVDWRRLTPLTRPAPYRQVLLFCGVLTCEIPGYPTAASGMTLQSVTFSSDEVGLIFSNYSFYAQDTWQATPRAILTYGLRWDINPSPSGQNVQLRGFVNPYDTNNLTLTPAGTPIYPTKYGDVAPRIGLAYRIHDTPGWETVLRGGFGIFYDLGSSIAGGVATDWPFSRSNITLFQPFPLPPAAAAPLPFSLTPPYGGVTTIDPKIEIPRTYQWNVALEQGVGQNQTVSLTYVGAAGRNLMRYVSLFPASAAEGYTVEASGGTSDYNALQVQYQRRLYKRLQALASYSWSHSIDTQSVNGGFNISANPNQDRASSDFDVRNSLSLALTYQPLGGNFGTLGNLFTHSWAFDAIYVAQTAKPSDLSATLFVGPSAPFDVRPDFVPGVSYFLHSSLYPGGKALNPAAFTTPPAYPLPGFLGDVPRNFFRGFNLSQLDIALHRQFPLYRNVTLQFRTEAFNVFNEANFSGYDGGLFDPTFGQSISTLNNSLNNGGSGLSPIYQIGGPRSIQLALKLMF